MMKPNTEPLGQMDGTAAALTSPTRRRLLTILLCLLFIGAGGGGATYIFLSAPKAQKRVPAKVIPVVEVQRVEPEDRRVTLPAMGTVIPAREVVLRSRVSGEVVSLHPEFIEGGYITEGAAVLQIDPKDYQLALIQKQRAVTEAEYALKLEMGHQDVARREWDLLNEGKTGLPEDLELALRKPHLAKARADLEGVRAELKQAELDLERTVIRAPFNAIVRSKSVDLGSQVTPQDSLAELVGVDEYWIQISVAVDDLKWIAVPDRNETAGSPVRLVHRNGNERTGVVIKLLGDLETEGRMARLLVSVKDPLQREGSGKTGRPLLIGEYVRVEIEGSALSQVFRIPRAALRENDTIWVAGNDSTLEIRPVRSIWRDTQTVLLQKGLNPGDRVIVSDLAAPVAGMEIRVEAN
jgi:RND family efflux transporter MFP subunit